MKKIILLFILIIILSSCITNNTNSTTSIAGMIYDSNNLPVNDVKILIDGIDNSIYSDINGRFVIPEIDYGSHTVTAMRTGFEKHKLSFELAEQDQTLYINMLSLGSIRKLIEKNLESEDYIQAQNYIERAKQINNKDIVVLYLEAIMYLKMGQPDESERILSNLMESGKDQTPIIDLLMYINEK